MVTAKLITIMAGTRVGLKSFVISRTTGLYGLKFAKSSALAGDFLNFVYLVGSVTAGIRACLACYCSQVYLKQKGVWKM